MTTSTATVTGSVNPNGAAVNVSFQFGTTTAYGQSTAVQKLGPDNAADTFSAALAGLPAGTTIHYRAIATGDFGTLAGADQTLKTSSPPPPIPGKAKAGKPHVSGTSVTELITCIGQTSCKVTMKLTIKVTRRGHKIVADLGEAQAQAEGHPQGRGPRDDVGDDPGRPEQATAGQPQSGGTRTAESAPPSHRDTYGEPDHERSQPEDRDPQGPVHGEEAPPQMIR